MNEVSRTRSSKKPESAGFADRFSTGRGSRAEVSPRFRSVADARCEQSKASSKQSTKRKSRGGFQGRSWKSPPSLPRRQVCAPAGVSSCRAALLRCSRRGVLQSSQEGGAAAWGRGEQSVQSVTRVIHLHFLVSGQSFQTERLYSESPCAVPSPL